MSSSPFEIFTSMIEEDNKLFYTMSHYKKEKLIIKKRRTIFSFIHQIFENSDCPNKVKFLSMLYFDIFLSKNDCSLLSSDLLTSILSLTIALAIKVEGGDYEGRRFPTITEISSYTNIAEDVLFKLEIKILKALNWKTTFVSAEDLIYLFFNTHLKGELDEKEAQIALKASIYFYKNLFLFDENPYQYTGVSIAICCISQALIEMEKTNALNKFIKMAKKQELIEGADMNTCWNEMQQKIKDILEEI